MKIVNSHQAQAWNGYEGQHWADNHDRYNTLVSGLNKHLFAVAKVGPGDRVLDIGCGAGQTTRLAAGLASQGHAVGVDLSEPMLDRARRIAAEEGISNVTFEQADAQVHSFPTAGFDLAISRGGIMYFSDPVAAFANIGRALVPGGRLVFGCGRDYGENEFDRIWEAMMRHVELPDPAEDNAPGPVNFTNSGQITSVLTEAGFAQVTAEPRESVSVFGRDAEDATTFIFGWGPVRHWLRNASSADVAAARESVADALRTFEIDGAVRLSGPSWVFTAVAEGA
ncbi:class I SAM-dependent methyltransferase [Nocardia sp. GCM10030253]|uniref:class I SAM-dependent methyltransferase n=1 Tax=Nocardia sp. GCM10030253 TaxID=3273404 RepID=UPI00362C184E